MGLGARGRRRPLGRPGAGRRERERLCVSRRTEQLGVFAHREFEQLAPLLDGFSLMTYDYPAAQQ